MQAIPIILLQRWTNDRFRSTWHRVVSRNQAERFSIATFYDPSFDALVDPLALLDASNKPALYKPISAGDHIMNRITESFAYRQKLPA
jgi:isopenicillin N synthase-like dioxygenase